MTRPIEDGGGLIVWMFFSVLVALLIACCGCTMTIQGPHAEFNGHTIGARVILYAEQAK